MSKGIPRGPELIKYIKAFKSKYKRMPTRKEIYHDLGMGHGVLKRILDYLVRDGYLIEIPTGILEYKLWNE